jgi:hypothetical protein
MTRRHVHLQAIMIASAASLILGCSDEGYKGPLPTLTGGSGGMSSGSGGNEVTSGGNGGTGVTGETGGGESTGGATGTGGGTGGNAAGSTGAGGSGVTPDAGSDASTAALSPIPMDMLQHKWKYVHVCKFINGQPVSNFPTCSEGNNDICWETANGARWFDPNPPVWKFAGDPNKTYLIKIHMHAISEPKTYKNCKEVNTRTDNGRHPMVCDGTGQNITNPGENFNILNLRFNDPRQDYYMNMAEIDEPHRVEKLDEVWTIKAKGQSTVTFLFDDLNGGEIRNCPKYTFPGVSSVAPYDNTPIDGEFWQWDCEDPTGGDACWTVMP